MVIMLEVMEHKPAVILITGEALIFILFFSFLWQVNLLHFAAGDLFYYLYVAFTICFTIYVSLTDKDLRSSLGQLVGSKDMIALMVIMVAWILVFAIAGQDTYQLFLFYPVYLDEINFRFVIQRKVASYLGPGRAVVVQAVLFTLFYSSYFIFEVHGYPYPYNFLAIIDTFSMGIIYGLLYYFRKNIYWDLALHFSAIGISYVAQFLPGYLIWLPYVLSPD